VKKTAVAVDEEMNLVLARARSLSQLEHIWVGASGKHNTLGMASILGCSTAGTMGLVSLQSSHKAAAKYQGHPQNTRQNASEQNANNTCLRCNERAFKAEHSYG
jgi:hypothetical protein